MLIKSTFNINNKCSYEAKYTNQRFKQVRDTVSFSGHSNIENCAKKGIDKLIHQTALGRELKTKLFVRDYIYDNFSQNNKINLFCGGCSTGEESTTYSMLLHGLKDKVVILGVDLGKDAIKRAQSRKFIFEVPKKNVNLLDYFNSIDDSPYTDSYLLNAKNNGLSPEQSYFKSLFKEFFVPTNKKIRTPFGEYIHNLIEKRNGENPLELDRVEYKLKDEIGQNCRYKVGDVRDIDKITGGEKQNVISFCNALYHLTTYSYDYGMRASRQDSEKVITNLMSKFKNSLTEKGIVVFGENEGPQLLDNEVVPKVMQKLDFEPLNKTISHEANVWRVNKNSE